MDKPTGQSWFIRRFYRIFFIGILGVFGIFLAIDLGFCIIGTLDKDFPIAPWWSTSNRTERVLSKNLKLIECTRTDFFPFFGMAENGRRFMFPGFMFSTSLESQWLEREGKKIYEPTKNGLKMMDSKDYHLSPDGKFLLAVDGVHVRPFEILDLDCGRIQSVQEIDFEGHYYTYPFTFLRWDEDSKGFTAEVTGTFVKNPGMNNAEFLAYREVWRFISDSGKATRLSRQEQPWQTNLVWK